MHPPQTSKQTDKKTNLNDDGRVSILLRGSSSTGSFLLNAFTTWIVFLQAQGSHLLSSYQIIKSVIKEKAKLKRMNLRDFQLALAASFVAEFRLVLCNIISFSSKQFYQKGFSKLRRFFSLFSWF